MVLVYVAGLLIVMCLSVDGWQYYLLVTLSTICVLVSELQYKKMINRIDDIDDIDERLKEATIDIRNLHLLYWKMEAGNNEGTYGKTHIGSKTSDEPGDKKSAG